MSTFFSRIVSLLMAAIAFLFPWLPIDRTDADLKIELAANATTGYSWSCEIEDESVLVLAGSSYKESPHPAGTTGVGGTQYYYFNALSQGQTAVTFTYSRPWQGGETGEVLIYTVTVDADMNVSYTVND